MALQVRTISLDGNPDRFYGLCELAKSVGDDQRINVAVIMTPLGAAFTGLMIDLDGLTKVISQLTVEARMGTRKKNPFGVALEKDDEDQFADLRKSDGYNFLLVVHDIFSRLLGGLESLCNLGDGLCPAPLLLLDGRVSWQSVTDPVVFQKMAMELQINKPTVDRFVSALLVLEQVHQGVSETARHIEGRLAGYHSMLSRRHSVEGMKVIRDPVITDVALTIYENVDANGEIADGASPDEISAYSRRKAELIAGAVGTGMIGLFVNNPGVFVKTIVKTLELLDESVDKLQVLFKSQLEGLYKLVPEHSRRRQNLSGDDVSFSVGIIQDLDPLNVTFKAKNVLLTQEERYLLEFQNETLKELVAVLGHPGARNADGVVRLILERKSQLRKYFQDENSFYSCRIGHGNPFSGEAPGALMVIPATRPLVSMADIIGSGFEEIREHVHTIELSEQWHDLFVATSPSKSADKNNVLLVGPPGSGKSEVLRAVGGDKGSIGIYAQGSDFNTCWKGEAEKNPKRLFEAGMRLQKESRKHVHFLIDEIDEVLNSDRSYGSTNLTLEFQILMDGVLQYPHLSVWGATNNLERIPMAMIRRFAKVLIVGELSQTDRVTLFKQYLGVLPTKDFSAKSWNGLAEKVEGATGDVIRQIADSIWREKLRGFTAMAPDQAKSLVAWLNDGQKFQVRSFTSARREELKTKLVSAGVVVTPTEVNAAIGVALSNVAIHHEIKTAVETYTRAKKFVASLSGKAA